MTRAGVKRAIIAANSTTPAHATAAVHDVRRVAASRASIQSQPGVPRRLVDVDAAEPDVRSDVARRTSSYTRNVQRPLKASWLKDPPPFKPVFRSGSSGRRRRVRSQRRGWAFARLKPRHTLGPVVSASRKETMDRHGMVSRPVGLS